MVAALFARLFCVLIAVLPDCTAQTAGGEKALRFIHVGSTLRAEVLRKLGLPQLTLGEDSLPGLAVDEVLHHRNHRRSIEESVRTEALDSRSSDTQPRYLLYSKLDGKSSWMQFWYPDLYTHLLIEFNHQGEVNTVVFVSEEDGATKRFGEGARPWARKGTSHWADSSVGSHSDQDGKAFAFLIKESSRKDVRKAGDKKALQLSVEVENLREEPLEIFEAVLSWPGGSAVAMTSEQTLMHFEPVGSGFENIPPQTLALLTRWLLQPMVPWFENITPQTLSPREKAELRGRFVVPRDLLDKRLTLQLTLNRVASAEVRRP